VRVRSILVEVWPWKSDEMLSTEKMTMVLATLRRKVA
jgi:hypothetical protein